MRLHTSNNNYNRALKSIRVWEKRVVTREIRKNIGQINEVLETRKTVEESVGRKKRKPEPSEKQKAKMKSVIIRCRDFKKKYKLQLLFVQSYFTYFNSIISSKSQQNNL